MKLRFKTLADNFRCNLATVVCAPRAHVQALEVSHLLAHLDWANDLILLDQLSRWSSISNCA